MFTALVLAAVTVASVHGALVCPQCADPYDVNSCNQRQSCAADNQEICQLQVNPQDNDRVAYQCSPSHECANFETPNCDETTDAQCVYCCNSVAACDSITSQLFASGSFVHVPGTTSVGAPHCITQADIALLMDSSGSIDATEFDTMLQFVRNLTQYFQLGPSDVQIAAATFGTSVTKVFDLNSYTDHAQLEQAILSTTRDGGVTNTNLALDLARDDLFLTQNGGRSGVPKLAIVLTDGQSSDGAATDAAAQALKAAGVTVISIGIGDGTDPAELALMASGANDTFQVASFNVLDTIENEIALKTCELLQPTTCVTQSDMLFLLDSSGSIDTTEYNALLQFVVNLTRNFDIGPDAVQFAAATFGTNVQKVFDFNDYTDHASLEQGILAAPHLGGSTYTNLALDLARDDTFLAQYGSRADVPKIVVVLTDGQSTNGAATITEANALKAMGATVISVGIGNGVDPQELQDIASSPSDTFQVADFHVLDTIQQELTSQTCAVSEDKCTTAADIALILDSSGSIDSSEYNTMLQFARDVTRNFKIGPNDVQFATVTFGTNVQKVFDLNSFADHASLEQALLATPHLGGSTYTNLALDLARDDVFTTANGNRQDVPKIAVILTDGQSTNNALTIQEANALKASGVTVIAVGIGNGVDPQELQAIATGPSDTFQVADFNVLHTIEDELAQRSCQLSENDTCTSQADIAVLLDSSGSIDTTEYNTMLQFVSDLTRNFDLGPNGVQFAGITFGTNVQKVFDLNQYQDHAALAQAILAAPHLGGSTYTNLALDMARDDTFLAQYGARPGVPQIVLVLTDGQSTNGGLTIQEADALKAAGVTVVTVGIGNGVDPQELASMASGPSDTFQVADFHVLDTIEHELVQQTCIVSLTTPACITEADIALLLDSSGSISDDDWVRQLQFAADLTQNFDLGPNAVQFGAVIFGTQAQKLFNLDAFTDHASLEQSLLQTTHLAGNTATDQALQMAYQDLFTQASGARPGVPQIAIILTDGQSTDAAATAAQAQALKASGATVVAIGVGSNIDPAELATIASGPSDTFQVADYTVLDTIQHEIANNTCAIVSS